MIDIETERLILRLVPLAGLAAMAANDIGTSRRLIGASLPPEWFENAWVADMRLKQWTQDPGYAPWSIRAIALKSGEIVGNMNCHDQPRLFEYNGERALAVEMGYTIFATWRRRGIAFEAVSALMKFAKVEGVRWVVLSVSPGNAPSLALARKLGARKIGSQVDEKDGPEDIFLVEL